MKFYVKAEKCPLKSPLVEASYSPNSPRRYSKQSRHRETLRRLFPHLLLTCGFAIFILVNWTRAGSTVLLHLLTYRPFRRFLSFDSAILDATRSKYHEASIRPSVAYELSLLNSTGIFASWYGNPHQQGPSPFDYVLPREWQASLSGRKRWTIIAPSDLDCGNSSDEEICDIIAGLRSSKNRYVHVLGPEVSTLVQTDVLITLARVTITEQARSLSISLRRQPLHIHLLEECKGSNCIEDVVRDSSGITLSRHAFELVDFFEHHKLKKRHGNLLMQLFGHLPYSASPERYFPPNHWQDKVANLLDVDGVLNGKTEREEPLEAHDYRKAKLCLFTSTSKKRMSREWVKAMLSGCVIVSDMPTESEEFLADAIVQYDPLAPPEDIWRTITEALRDDAALQRKALRAFIYARQHFTPARQLGYILQLTELHRAGERGYDFPMPFSAVCRVYPDDSKPSWC